MKVRTGQQIIDYSGKGWQIGEGGVKIGAILQFATAATNFASINDNALDGLTGITCTGVKAGDLVLQVKAATQIAGVVITGHVTADDTVALIAINGSGGAADLASQAFTVTVLRPQT